MSEPSPEPSPSPGPRATWIALAVALLAALAGAAGVSMERSLGWDESMHAALPAARIVLALEAGEPREAADVVLDCQQYPPVVPLYLAAVQLVAGLDEQVARAALRALWGLGLFGVFLLVRESVTRMARDGRPVPAGAGLAPPIAVGLALTAPMAWAFSGTFFLEVPFVVVASFALWAWMRRDGAGGRGARWRRDLLAGALLAVAFFTKFNYALLLGLGLFVDLAFETLSRLRAGRGREGLERIVALGLAPGLGWLWWFVLPLPGGAEVAASHREAFLGFLGGNTQLAATPYAVRAFDVVTFLAPSTAVAVLLGVGLLRALVLVRRPAVRTLILVAAATWGPTLAHNFHLERFLLPPALALWSLSAVGLALLVPRSPAGRAGAGAVAVLALAAGLFDGPPTAAALGLRTADNADYLGRLIDERRALGPGRALPTAGLRREEYDQLVDAAAAAAGPEARIGWVGINSELSPAALHLGLLARGGSPERLRRDAGRVRPDGQPDMVVTFEGVDPGWDPELLRGWASGFDLLLSTEPLDWKGRRHRDFLGAYRSWLFEGGRWHYASAATVEVERAGGERHPVELYVCRPAGE